MFKDLAQICISSLERNLNESEQSIPGMPLLCSLLADIFIGDVKAFGTSRMAIENFQFSSCVKTIFEMYKTYIEEQFSKVTYKDERHKAIEYHIFRAFKFIFPQFVCDTELDLDAATILKIGLMETRNQAESPRFVHRTFAEYFVAQYLFLRVKENLLFVSDSWIKEGIDFADILHEAVLKADVLDDTNPFQAIQGYKSNHHLSAYFLDQHFRSLKFEDHASDLQTLFHSSLFYDTEEFYKIITMCVTNDFQGLYDFTVKTFMCTQFLDILVTEDKPWENCILLAAKHSNLEIFKLCCDLVTILRKASGETLTFPLLSKISQQCTPLHVAVSTGNYQLYEYLTQSIPNYYVEHHSTFLLHICVADTKNVNNSVLDGKLEILNSLYGLNPELLEMCEETSGRTPILMNNIHIELLAHLMSLGANLSATEGINRENLAHIAASYLDPNDYYRFCQLIIQEYDHAVIFRHVNDNGDTPVHNLLKIMNPLVENLKLLSNNIGTRFNNRNKDGYTELFTAIKSGRSREVLKSLVDLGGNWKLKHRSKLYVSHFTLLNFGSIELFVSLGADVNKRYPPYGGLTPLALAVFTKSKFEIVESLLQNGADISFKADIVGATVIHLLVIEIRLCSEQYFKAVLRLLIDYGANINAKSFHGLTALHFLLLFGNIKKGHVKILLECRANVNAKDDYGCTPLMYINENETEIIDFLKQYGGVKVGEKWIIHETMEKINEKSGSSTDLEESDSHTWLEIMDAAVFLFGNAANMIKVVTKFAFKNVILRNEEVSSVVNGIKSLFSSDNCDLDDSDSSNVTSIEEEVEEYFNMFVRSNNLEDDS